MNTSFGVYDILIRGIFKVEENAKWQIESRLEYKID